MSKKDYIFIANAIKAQVQTHSGESACDAAVRSSLNELANTFVVGATDANPRFNATTFKSACGLI